MIKFRAWGRNGNYPGSPSEKFEMFYDVSVVTTYHDKEQHVIADFGMYNESDYNGTDIIDYTFYIETEKFDFSKLLFLTFSNYADFRGNSLTTLANYVFYDNNIVQPDESWHRDKGIELEYESKDISLDFLING